MGLLLYRNLHEASFVFLEVFRQAQARVPKDAGPVGMTHADLDAWVRSLDPDGFGKALKASTQPDHLLRTWVARAVADGVLERAEAGRFAKHCLTDKGRRCALLAP
jgi:hypothetical protein